jgi:hypothetical protein
MSSTRMISNPILRGFNPDPSILRVGDDYYIATSTFEWFPGVQIHVGTRRPNGTTSTARLWESTTVLPVAGWSVRSPSPTYVGRRGIRPDP